MTRAGISPEETRRLLKEKRYDAATSTLTLTDVEAQSFGRQVDRWQGYFVAKTDNRGLPAKFITDPGQ